jgi:hypothetical protein
VARDLRYFAYGTLQQGFSNYERFAGDLGVPLGRYRTVEPFPLVVPRAGMHEPGLPVRAPDGSAPAGCR